MPHYILDLILGPAVFLSDDLALDPRKDCISSSTGVASVLRGASSRFSACKYVNGAFQDHADMKVIQYSSFPNSRV